MSPTATRRHHDSIRTPMRQVVDLVTGSMIKRRQFFHELRQSTGHGDLTGRTTNQDATSQEEGGDQNTTVDPVLRTWADTGRTCASTVYDTITSLPASVGSAIIYLPKAALGFAWGSACCVSSKVLDSTYFVASSLAHTTSGVSNYLYESAVGPTSPPPPSTLSIMSKLSHKIPRLLTSTRDETTQTRSALTGEVTTTIETFSRKTGTLLSRKTTVERQESRAQVLWTMLRQTTEFAYSAARLEVKGAPSWKELGGWRGRVAAII